MHRLVWMSLALVALARLIALQRMLEAARNRGDMYRDIALRLDRQLRELKQRDDQIAA